MLTIDRSPGQFIVWSNLVVYGVIGTEIWMWTAASVLAVAFTLALIATIAGLICRGMNRVLEERADVPAPLGADAAPAAPAVAAASPAAAAAVAAAPVPVRRAAVRPGRTVAHV